MCSEGEDEDDGEERKNPHEQTTWRPSSFFLKAKAKVKIEAATQTYATVTLQNYFRMYHKLSGMTGTAETEAGEFWDIYKLDVVVIPTNRPSARDDREDLVYKTVRENY